MNLVLFLLSDKHFYEDLLCLVLLDTTTCFGCPHQQSSGRELVHKKRKGERFLLTNCGCKVVIK